FKSVCAPERVPSVSIVPKPRGFSHSVNSSREESESSTMRALGIETSAATTARGTWRIPDAFATGQRTPRTDGFTNQFGKFTFGAGEIAKSPGGAARSLVARSWHNRSSIPSQLADGGHN